MSQSDCFERAEVQLASILYQEPDLSSLKTNNHSRSIHTFQSNENLPLRTENAVLVAAFEAS